MIRSLRKKFVFVAMCSTFAVLLVIMGTILVINYKGIVQRADRLLQIMEENGGELPREAFGQPGGQPQGEDGEFTEERDYSGEELSQGRPELDRSREREDWEPMLFSPETPFETRYFSVTLDDDGKVLETQTNNVAAVSKEAAEIFLFLAEYQGKKLELKIQENIFCRGEEKQIEQLISLLLDNSVKYSTPESTISLILEKKGKKAVLFVTNPSETIQKGDLSILFERFYRTDASRNSETGGSGIGLSVAKAIVAAHKGKIAAYSQDGCSVAVAVTIPCRES